RVAGFDGEVVFRAIGKMMATAHDLAHFVDAFLDSRSGTGARRNAQRIALRAVILAIGGERKNDPVVERSAERRAFFFADTDDLARNIVPTNFFSDGIDAGKKIFDDVHSNGADGGGAREIGFSDVAAFDEVHVVK